MWSRKCGQVRTVCCPEGTNDRSQPRKLSGLERIQSRIRPVGHGSDPYPGLIDRPNRGMPIGPNHTVPYGTVPVFARIPGNKLPGYFHYSLRDNKPSVAVHIFDSTSSAKLNRGRRRGRCNNSHLSDQITNRQIDDLIAAAIENRFESPEIESDRLVHLDRRRHG
jgi:hypothetical protein